MSGRQRIRPFYYGLLHSLWGPLKAGSAAILLYHSVSDQDNVLSVRPEQFARQMEYLAAHFRVVALADILRPDTNSAKPRVAITFDDGFLDNLEIAAPILREHGFPATCYVASQMLEGLRPSWVGSLPLMTWQQLRTFAGLGFEIGGHTLSHVNLHQDKVLLLQEIPACKALLEQRLGKEVTTFAYPRGEYDHDAMAGARAAGFANAVTTECRPVAPQDDLMAVPRIGVGRFISLPHFKALLSEAILRRPSLLKL